MLHATMDTKLMRGSSAMLRKVKEACREWTRKYDACLAKNEQDPGKCMPELRGLDKCVGEAKNRIPSEK